MGDAMMKAQPLPLFDDDTLDDAPALPILPHRILTMHLTYGRNDLCSCGTCAHLIRTGYRSATYFKCKRYAVSASASSDWRKFWTACGLWQQAGKSE